MAGQYELGDLGGVLGGDLYSSLFGSMGFDNNAGNPWANQEGFNEGSNAQWGFTPTEEAMGAFDDYSFNWNPEGGNNAGTLTAFDPSGKSYGTYKQKDEDAFTKLMNQVAPMAATWALGGPLSNMFGGGAMGGAMGQGLASGFVSAGQGGKFGQGFLSGAVGGGLNGLGTGTPGVMGNNPSAYVAGTPGTSIAGLSGITNPTLAGVVNRGSGSFLGGLAGGQSGSEALKSGLTGAALSGVNSAGKGAMDFYNNTLNSWLGGGTAGAGSSDAEFDSLPGSGGDMSSQTDVSPNRYAEMTTGTDGMESYNPDYGFGGDQLANTFSSGLSPQKSIQSSGQSDFSLASLLGNAGSGLGNFALNNAGDLASMLYGFYNNRKQQKALGQQASSLSSLYGQNSPYAQQLRAKLGAQAAQTGRRSNVAGRETQLQAMLADRNAQMSPHLMALNQARGQLKNNNLDIALMGLKKTGAMDMLSGGLKNLFGGNTYQGGGYTLTGVQNPYGSDVAFNGWGG
jgi:hypothetical protein